MSRALRHSSISSHVSVLLFGGKEPHPSISNRPPTTQPLQGRRRVKTICKLNQRDEGRVFSSTTLGPPDSDSIFAHTESTEVVNETTQDTQPPVTNATNNTTTTSPEAQVSSRAVCLQLCPSPSQEQSAAPQPDVQQTFGNDITCKIKHNPTFWMCTYSIRDCRKLEKRAQLDRWGDKWKRG
jgi:hypothetical protein